MKTQAKEEPVSNPIQDNGAGEIEPVKEKAKRPAWLLPGIGILAVVGIVYLVRSLSFSSNHQGTDDAFVTSHVISISPQIQGTVATVFVTDNQPVKKGTLLVQLNDSAEQAAYDQAKANLDLAIAQAQGAQLSVGLAGATGGAQILQAQGIVSQSQAGVDSSISDVAKAAALEAGAKAGVSGARAGISGAQAAYATALANVARAKAGVGSAQADLQTSIASAKASRSSVGAAQAAATRTEKDAQRAQTLVAQGAISAQTAEIAQAASDTARANLDAAQQTADAADATVNQRRQAIDAANQQVIASQAAVDQARSQITASQAQLVAAEANVNQASAAARTSQQLVNQSRGKAAQAAGELAQANTTGTQVALSKTAQQQAFARVEQAKAALKAAETNLAYTKIVAPEDGRVSKLTVTIGALVQPLFPMMSIIPEQASDPMWVVANFKETQLGDMKPGQTVDVEIDGVPGVTFHGKLDSISKGTGATFALLPADNSTGNFTKVVQRVPVKVTLDPGQADLERLSSGMSASVMVTTK